jgi:hypothetical protein
MGFGKGVSFPRITKLGGFVSEDFECAHRVCDHPIWMVSLGVFWADGFVRKRNEHI